MATHPHLLSLKTIYDDNVKLSRFQTRQPPFTSHNLTMVTRQKNPIKFFTTFKFLTLQTKKGSSLRPYDIFQVIQFIPNSSTHPNEAALILFNLNINDDCKDGYEIFRWLYILFDHTQARDYSLLELLYNTKGGYPSYYFNPVEGFASGDPTTTIENGFSKTSTTWSLIPYFFNDFNEVIQQLLKSPQYEPYQYTQTDKTYIRKPVAKIFQERKQAIDLITQSIANDPKYPQMQSENAIPFLVGLLTANLNNLAFNNLEAQREAIAYLCFGLHNPVYNKTNYTEIKPILSVVCLQEMNPQLLVHKVNVASFPKSKSTTDSLIDLKRSKFWLGLTIDPSHNTPFRLPPNYNDLLKLNPNDHTKYITLHQPTQYYIKIPEDSWSSYTGWASLGIPFIVNSAEPKIICRELQNGMYIMGCFEYYDSSTKSNSDLSKCYGMVINPNLRYNNSGNIYTLDFDESRACICRLKLLKTILVFNPVYKDGPSKMDNLIVANLHFACRTQGNGAVSLAKEDFMFFAFVVCPAILNDPSSPNFYMRSSYAKVFRALGDFNLPVDHPDGQQMSIIHLLQNQTELNAFFQRANIPVEQQKACSDFYNSLLRTETKSGKEGKAWRLVVSLTHTNSATYHTTAKKKTIERIYDFEYKLSWEEHEEHNKKLIKSYNVQRRNKSLSYKEKELFEQALLEMEEQILHKPGSIVCFDENKNDHDAILTISPVLSSDYVKDFKPYPVLSRSQREFFQTPNYRAKLESLATAASSSKAAHKQLLRMTKKPYSRVVLKRTKQALDNTLTSLSNMVRGRSVEQRSNSTGANLSIGAVMQAQRAATMLLKSRDKKRRRSQSPSMSGGSINKIQLIKEQIKIIKDKYKNTKLDKYLIQIDNLKHKITLQIFTDKLLTIKEKIKDYKTKMKANPNKKDKYTKHINKLVEKFNVFEQKLNTLKQNIKLKHTKNPKPAKDPKPTKETKHTKESKPTKETKHTKESKPTKDTKPTKESKPTNKSITFPKPTKDTKPAKDPKPTKETKHTKDPKPNKESKHSKE